MASAAATGVAGGGAGHVCKVYWPNEASGAGSGLVLGWNVRGFIVCVAAVIPYGDLEAVDAGLASFAADASLASVWHECGAPPALLGEWRGGGSDGHGGTDADREDGRDAGAISARRQEVDFWIELASQRGAMPAVVRISCFGVTYPRISHQIVFFDRPRWMHYLAATALDLELASSRHVAAASRSAASRPATDRSAGGRGLHGAALRAANRWGPGSAFDRAALSDMEATLPQINATRLVQRLASEAGLVEARVSRPIASRTLALVHAVWRTGSRALPGKAPVVSATLDDLGDAVLGVLRRPLPAVGSVSSFSATGRLAAFQLESLALFPERWRRARFGIHTSTHEARANAVTVLNVAALAAVDVALGLLFAFICLTRGAAVTDLVASVAARLSASLDAQIMWLMGWPAGFKLNSNLAQTLGATIMGGLRIWNACILWVWAALTSGPAFRAFAMCGGLGISFVVALSADALALATIHVWVIYNLTGTCLRAGIGVLSSLWQLFRGKKFNVLRRRIDHCNYDLDQLLLGTVLFAILFFLLPTIAVFHLFFAAVQLSLTLVQMGAALVVAGLTRLPAMPLLLFALIPAALPGGIRFEYVAPAEGDGDGDADGGDRDPTDPRWMAEAHRLRDASRSGKRATYLSLSNRKIPVGRLLADLVTSVSGILSPRAVMRNGRLVHGVPLTLDDVGNDQ